MSDIWELVDGNFSTTRAVAATRRGLFVIDEDTHLYQLDPLTGAYDDSIERGFRSTHMVGLGDQLYVWEPDGTLYRVDPADQTCEALDGTWHDVRAVAALGDRLFAVAARTLYAIDPETGDAETLENSWDTRHLIGHREHLFAWEADNALYRVEPSTGEADALDNNWPLTTGVASACGKLYAVDDGILYEVDPDSGGCDEVTDRMRTQLLIGLHSCLYSFAANGDLYRIQVG